MVRSGAVVTSVSVVIPYYEDAAGLTQVVTAVRAQEFDGQVEVIVADDGSPTPPPPDLDVTVVRQDDRGFRAAAARNLGASVATGDVLVFLDGDTVPEPGFLRALVPHVEHDRRCIAVATRLTGPEQQEPQWLQDAWEQTNHLADADDTSWRFILSAALACSREFFEHIGGFDGSIVGYGGEDWEFAFHAWNEGATFVHEPAAVATHDEPDWGGRGADAGEKNVETVALAHRISHPLARPRGVILEVPDILVVIDSAVGSGQDGAGVMEALVSAWLDTGDVHVSVPTAQPLFQHDPRVHQEISAQPAGSRGAPRIIIHLEQAATPSATLLQDIGPALDARHPLDLVLNTADGAVRVGSVTTRRARALAHDATDQPQGRPTALEVPWELLEGPVRLERFFAGW